MPRKRRDDDLADIFRTTLYQHCKEDFPDLFATIQELVNRHESAGEIMRHVTRIAGSRSITADMIRWTIAELQRQKRESVPADTPKQR